VALLLTGLAPDVTELAGKPVDNPVVSCIDNAIARHTACSSSTTTQQDALSTSATVQITQNT